MHWHAHGESGEIYGLYANFWGPHERLFGEDLTEVGGRILDMPDPEKARGRRPAGQSGPFRNLGVGIAGSRYCEPVRSSG